MHKYVQVCNINFVLIKKKKINRSTHKYPQVYNIDFTSMKKDQ